MTKDLNKGIVAIEYNHLNMPTKVTVTGENEGELDYVYDANGIKLQKVNTQGGVTTTTDYANDFVYENNVLKQFYQPEGYVEPDGSSWQYVYQYRDIWNNTRITYADDNNDGSVNSSEIRREQNFYPFGLEHRGYNNVLSGVKNNLKTYQGQEFTEDLGLNTHEWKYRMSDPAIGRFWQVDPLAEDYYYNSTYAFQENKMGMGIELEGAELLPFNPSSIFNFEGGKTTLTFGLHNIKPERASRRVAPEGSNGFTKAVVFIGNSVASAYNGAVDTWNQGMQGATLGDMTADGVAEMGNTVRRIENGEGTIQDAENLTGAAITAAVTARMAPTSTRSRTASADVDMDSPVTSEIYQRPNNATTPAQRASVQNKNCVDCGGTSNPMVADHKTPLVVEHYTTGTINRTNMRSVNAVQPQCRSCSASQGGRMSNYSKRMKAQINAGIIRPLLDD